MTVHELNVEPRSSTATAKNLSTGTGVSDGESFQLSSQSFVVTVQDLSRKGRNVNARVTLSAQVQIVLIVCWKCVEKVANERVRGFGGSFEWLLRLSGRLLRLFSFPPSERGVRSCRQQEQLPVLDAISRVRWLQIT